MINFNSWFLLLLYFNSISSCTRLSSFKVHLSLPQFVRSLMSVLSKIKFRIKIKIEIFFRYWSFVRIIFLQLFSSSPSETIPLNFEPNLGSVRRWKMAFQDKDRFQSNGFQNSKGKLNNLESWCVIQTIEHVSKFLLLSELASSVLIVFVLQSFRKDGFKRVQDAVGAYHNKWKTFFFLINNF